MPTDSDIVNRLAQDPTLTAAPRRRIPTSTYRLQMHHGFAFKNVLETLPYFESLGVSHLYMSSLLTSRPGSTHGYDVLDHSQLNPEIGTEEEFAQLVEELRRRNMGLILDVVPNHMFIGADNAWWNDVLENGPSSPYASYFDIAWQDHPRARLHGKVLLPILGEPYGKVLRAGNFKIEFRKGAFVLLVNGAPLPVDPRTYHMMLQPALDSARAVLGAEEETVIELSSILNSVKHLPPRDEPDAARRSDGRLEIGVIKRRLGELVERNPVLLDHIQGGIDQLVGPSDHPHRFDALDQLIDSQAYRACFWHVASDEINYRRFFDVNDLAALSTEREDVFRAIHRKIFDWLARGWADGLRIDHPDGLFDPKQYLERLQTYYQHAVGAGGVSDGADANPTSLTLPAPSDRLYVVVEKILGHQERIPDDWICDGTTGYEALNVINGLFVDRERQSDLTRLYESLTDFDDSFSDLAYRKKYLILQTALVSELHMLAHQLDRLAQADWGTRDFTLNGLRHALREVIASFPVYRTYIDGSSNIRDTDKRAILHAIRRARNRNPVLGRAVFEFIRDTLLLQNPPSGPASDEYRQLQKSFAGKFQQLTSPVTAKGVEDTSFYIHHRLVSLNEVGGDPDVYGWTATAAHAYFRQRQEQKPGGLTPLSTHDTKRSEDVRAHIDVLSEIPEEWAEHLRLWIHLNRGKKTQIDEDLTAPEVNEEMLLYQTLVGAWPGRVDTEAGRAEFTTRIQEYMKKSLREAKVHSSWIHPDQVYDEAVRDFIGNILNRDESPAFLDDLERFQKRIAPFGYLNSLAASVLRATVPGVPDTYQGTEIGDFSLVDPDNRRPVDYRRRQEMLDGLKGFDPAGWLDHLADGRCKLLSLSRLLQYRRQHPNLFGEGAYEEAAIRGEQADHVFGFWRELGGQRLLVLVPRLLARTGKLPVDVEFWGQTELSIDEAKRGRTWTHLFTGEVVSFESGSALVRDLLAKFPVAVLNEL